MDDSMKTTVIYILGSGHSGSTLLDLILGSNSRIQSVGEIRRIARILNDAAERSRRMCSCGERLASCPYWMPVLGRLRSSGMAGRRFLETPATAARDNEMLVAELLRQSAKQVYAESTKTLARLKSLVEAQKFEVFVIHLIRDGRAVAWSNVRKGRNPFHYLHHWMKTNVRILAFRRGWRGPWLTVKYERLAIDPLDEVKRIMEFVGEPFEPDQLNFSECVHHNLFGNRMRRAGSSEIAPDIKYLTQIGRAQWRLTTAYAFVVLKLFGYPLTRRGAEIMLVSEDNGGAAVKYVA